jgi:hypothetical protein
MTENKNISRVTMDDVWVLVTHCRAAAAKQRETRFWALNMHPIASIHILWDTGYVIMILHCQYFIQCQGMYLTPAYWIWGKRRENSRQWLEKLLIGCASIVPNQWGSSTA